MCLDAPVTMPPKVALIIPERKLLNLGVFVEKMKAQCLFLPPRWEGSRARMAARKQPPGSAAHSEAGAPGCLQPLRLGQQTARLRVPGEIPGGGDSQAGTSPGGWGHPSPLSHGKVGGLCCAGPPLPPSLPRSFSQPRISGCASSILFSSFLLYMSP